MTDRELIELAAKAAGIQIWEGDGGPWRESACGTGILLAEGINTWSPLTDDGDALRLMVKLGLQVTPGTYNSEEATAYRSGHAEARERVHFQQDIGAATRRAIVRAAAEIGRGM